MRGPLTLSGPFVCVRSLHGHFNVGSWACRRWVTSVENRSFRSLRGGERYRDVTTVVLTDEAPCENIRGPLKLGI
jgi:hypothetical protein